MAYECALYRHTHCHSNELALTAATQRYRALRPPSPPGRGRPARRLLQPRMGLQCRRGPLADNQFRTQRGVSRRLTCPLGRTRISATTVHSSSGTTALIAAYNNRRCMRRRPAEVYDPRITGSCRVRWVSAVATPPAWNTRIDLVQQDDPDRCLHQLTRAIRLNPIFSRHRMSRCHLDKEKNK